MPGQIIKTAKALCEKFINKVEAGKARSRETYTDCKALLKMINENEQKVIDKAFGRGTATEVKICDRIVRLGDKLRVRYTTGERFRGATIEGTVIELWSDELNDHHEKLHQKMTELEDLQKQHIHETGRRYVAPFYLMFTDKKEVTDETEKP